MYNGVYNKESFAYQYDTLRKWLNKTVNGENLAAPLVRHGINRVSVYGISGLGEMVITALNNSEIEVACLSDSRSADFGGEYCGIPVVPPTEIPQDIDAVIVTAEFYFREIMETLISCRVPIDKIISLAMLVE